MSTKLIVSCIGGAGALGGTAGGCYYLLSNKETTDKSIQKDQPSKGNSTVSTAKQTLKEVLAGADFVALNTTARTNDTHWRKLVTKHKDNGFTGKKIEINGALEENPSDNDLPNIQKLQTACAKLLAKTDDISAEDKEIAKSWCNEKSILIGG